PTRQRGLTRGPMGIPLTTVRSASNYLQLSCRSLFGGEPRATNVVSRVRDRVPGNEDKLGQGAWQSPPGSGGKAWVARQSRDAVSRPITVSGGCLWRPPWGR